MQCTDSTAESAAAMSEAGIRSLVDRAFAAWAIGDIDATLDCFAADAVYTLHLDPDVLAFSGVSRGRSALRSVLVHQSTEFEYILFRPLPLAVHGQSAHQQVEFMFRHKSTGETLSGRLRLVWTFADARARTLSEFHDTERVEAFLRLCAARGRELN